MTNIDRLLDIARQQIGVKEHPAGSNNVLYNTWFYGQEVYDGLWNTKFPWCMACVQWLFHEAGMPLPYKTAGCYPFLSWYRVNAPQRIVMLPEPGDIAIYPFGSGHTGVVEEVLGDTFVAIEGNTSATSNDNGGAVMRRTRAIRDVEAFIRAYDTVQITEEEDPMDYEKWKEYMQMYREELQNNQAGAWSQEDREWAVANGIIRGSGTIDGEPNYMWRDFVTREQLAAIEHRVTELKN